MTVKWHKIVVCAFTALLVLSMMPAAATAEEYQTSHFELLLPARWRYDVSMDCYVNKEHNSRIYLFEYNVQALSDTVDDFDYLLRLTKRDLNYSKSERMMVDGQTSILATLRNDFNFEIYGSALHTEGYVCYVVYVGNAKNYGKEEFVDLLQGFHVRQKEDVGYFRYGDAEAKLLIYQTYEASDNTYITLSVSWRNVGTKATTYTSNIKISAYQDGIELPIGYFRNVDTEKYTKILPGAELVCTEIFILRSETTTIKLIMDMPFDMMDEYEDREFTIQIK